MNDIKSLILDKARERMNRFGYKKTTMDEISRDCKISKKTIYEHFSDKEDMFRSLLLRECQKTIELLFLRLGSVPDTQERLVKLIQFAVEYLNEDQFLTRILKDEDALFLTCFNQHYFELIDEQIISIIAEIVAEGKQMGKFRNVDEKIAAYAIFKLFQSVSYRRTSPLSKDRNEPIYTEAIIDFIINALVIK